MALEGLDTAAAVTARMKQLAGATGAAAIGVNRATTTLIAYNGNGQ